MDKEFYALVPNATTQQAIAHTQAIIEGSIPDDGLAFSNADDAIAYLIHSS